MLLCAVVAWLANVIANKMATGISRDFIIRLRRDLFTRISGLSASQRNRLTDASLISRLTTDTYNVHNMVDRMQRLGIRAPIMLLGGNADKIVRFSQAEELCEALIASGNSAELVMVDGAEHEGNFWSESVLKEIYGFLSSHI